MQLKTRLPSLAIYVTATLSGVMVLLYPFFLPALSVQAGFSSFRAGEMPLLMTLLLGLCLLVLLLEAQGPVMNTRLIALLGVLVAINSALRFIETAIPGPGGFSPIFFLVILVGYVFGGRTGFLMGALTMLVSGLVTGGVGPWLPGQMFTAGWVGMSAALLRPLMRPFVNAQAPAPTTIIHREIIALAIFGFAWGFIYGMVMNLWQWPFIIGPQAQSWSAGLSLAETFQRYLAFYLVTSLVWDAIAAVGNVVLIVAFGAATLRALRRFRERFVFQYTPEMDSVMAESRRGSPG